MNAHTSTGQTSTPRRVLFLDTNGVGFSQNLMALRDEMLRHGTPVQFSYLFCNLEKKTPEDRAFEEGAIRDLCRSADIVVCATDSLPDGLSGLPAHQRRLLLNPPRQAAIGTSRPPQAAISAYTDVIVQNEQYVAHATRLYAADAPARVHPLGLPAIDSFADPDAVGLARRRMLDLVPQAEGRDIIVLDSHYEASVVLSDVDLGCLAEQLAEEYFLVISAPKSGRLLEQYRADISHFVFDTGNVISTFGLLLAADTLVCTRFTDAVYFSASGRPLLYLHPTRSLPPKELAPVTIGSLGQLADSLDKDLRSASERFRSEYVAPNLNGNAARILSEVLGIR